jgi:hypothetical protein
MVLILLLFLPALLAQQTAEPLPRKLAGREPSLIVKGLLGSADGQRETLQLLALDPASKVNSARLVSAQLDNDPELEAILVVDLGTATVIRVYDKGVEGWWEVGQLDSAPGANYKDPRKVPELRPVTHKESKDILLRGQDLGCAAGFCSRGMVILHMHEGRLYPIFQTTEWSGALCFFETREVSFPRFDTAVGQMVVRYTRDKQAEPPEGCGKPKPPEHRCAVYTWDDASFSFGGLRKCSATQARSR